MVSSKEIRLSNLRWLAFLLCAALSIMALAAFMVLANGFVKYFNLIGILLYFTWLAAMAYLIVQYIENRTIWPTILFLILFSIFIRLWSASLAMDMALGADPMNYTNLATSLLEGRGLITDDWRYGQDLRAYFPPLYPIVLAGYWSIFGDSIYSTLSMNIIVDMIAAWALGDIARRTISARAAIICAAIYFAWPAFAMGAGMVQKESLNLLLVLLLFRAMIIWRDSDARYSKRWHHGFIMGIWWGLLSLVQPSLALTPAILGIILIWEKGFIPVIRLGLYALPALLIVLLPWWIRNYMLFESFVPFTTASGMMINSALRDLSIDFPPGLFTLPETERGAIMASKAMEFIVHNPLQFLQQAMQSMVYGFAYEEAPLARFRHGTPPISDLNHAQLAPLLQGAYASMLAVGAVASWKQYKNGTEPILYYIFLLLLSILMINIWFEFGERHRLIMTPLLMLMIAGFFHKKTITNDKNS